MYMVTGSHVSLDSIVYAFLSGHAAETIAQAFPGLGLEQVYGAITHYLAHRDDVERYLESRRQDFAAARQVACEADPVFYRKLVEARKRTRLTRRMPIHAPGRTLL
jgi:hypothetical protein